MSSTPALPTVVLFIMTVIGAGGHLPPGNHGPNDGTNRGQAFERFGKELLAGGVAGACGKSSVAPLERVKILIQTGRSPSADLHEVLRYIHKTDGVHGLFRGNGASVARIIPYAALHFSTYEHYRAALVQGLHCSSADNSATGRHTSDSRPPVWIDLLAGSCSGATAVVATYPLDLVRTRVAWEVGGQNKLRTTIVRTLQHIVRQEGVVGLYRGATATVMGILPYSGVKFFVYQKFKRAWSDAHPSPTHQKPPMYASLAFGAISGLMAQTLTYPVDVVRRRMQVSNISAGVEGTNASMIATTQAIIATQGWQGLFRGVYLNYIKVAPATAVGFCVYDFMKEVLGLENHL